MGRQVNSDCQVMSGTFFEKLAQTGRIDPITGDIFMNTYCYYVDCEDMESPLACEFNITDHEQWCADNFFTLDSCGYLAFKMGVCEKLFDVI
jgi:hypothetical protein